MKKTLLTIALGACAFLNAQTPPQLDNSGFEYWEDIPSGLTTIMEPINWSGLKTSDDPQTAQLVPDGTLSRDVGRDGTGYCVKLETKDQLFIPVNGSITNGRFHAPESLIPAEGYIYTDPNDSRWHYTYSWKPDSLVGWYKYEPVGNDQGKCEVVMHDGGGALPLIVYGETDTPNPVLIHDYTSNRVGRARFNWTASTNGQWVRFSVPFEWYDTRNSEYALVVITSGDSTISQIGSKVWVDDIELVFNNLSIDEYDYNKAFTVFYDQENIIVNVETDSKEVFSMEVVDMMGKVVSKQSIESNQATILQNVYNKGIYFCRINTGSKFITRKIIKQ